ncbi:hypothetical protein [Oryza sativa Japonica Group]|uniref:Uncharacterized protein P0416D03.4 n=1 Tax=Oryza sativa subsp. japonica TaxID=39947 RepID=Q5ZDM5_ORYSJ|nr:hypothetical protein [Oryza sativa Japonica Group]
MAAQYEVSDALGALGVAAISTATTLATAAFQPPPAPGGLRTTTTYNHLAVAGLAGTFLGGVVLVGASVWVSDNPAARRGTGKKLLYAAVPMLLAAVVLSVAALLWEEWIWSTPCISAPLAVAADAE